jgi:hypothetical protein
LQQIPCRAEQGIFLAAAGNFLGGAGEFREFTADWFHGIDLLQHFPVNLNRKGFTAIQR